MRIIVKDVYKEETTYCVTFLTQYGIGKGKWRGEVPVINNEYFVEIEIPQVLTWGEEITLADTNSCKLLTKESNLQIVGKLESIEDDGCAFVQFDDILIAFATEGNSFSIDTYIELSIREMILCEIKY